MLPGMMHVPVAHAFKTISLYYFMIRFCCLLTRRFDETAVADWFLLFASINVLNVQHR